MKDDIKIPSQNTNDYEDAKLTFHPSSNEGLVYVYGEYWADGHGNTTGWTLVKISDLKKAVGELD